MLPTHMRALINKEFIHIDKNAIETKEVNK